MAAAVHGGNGSGGVGVVLWLLVELVQVCTNRNIRKNYTNCSSCLNYKLFPR